MPNQQSYPVESGFPTNAGVKAVAAESEANNARTFIVSDLLEGFRKMSRG
jgi:hypothetical protein